MQSLKLSGQAQKLYSALGALLVAALVVGILWVLLGFADEPLDPSDTWQSTSLTDVTDVNSLFTKATQKARWFTQGQSTTESETDATKDLEGQPESLQLIGIVQQNNAPYALFLPRTSGQTLPTSGRKVKQLTLGDKLIGDWVVTAIESAQVQVTLSEVKSAPAESQPKQEHKQRSSLAAENIKPEMRTLHLYPQTPPKAP